MKIFLSGTSLKPAYGGPAHSVSRLATAMAELGLEVGLWTPDQSVVGTPFLSADTRVRRLTGSAGQALASFGNPDVLHDNGLWRPHNHRLAKLASTLGIPRLVSTRGMLEPWAVDHKRWRKRLAWPLYQRPDLARADGLHAAAGAEAATLQRLKLGVPIRVIPNGIDLPNVEDAVREKQGDFRTAIFLGRIFPVKGLPMLIEAWARVRPEGWRLRIAGPDERGHRRTVESLVTAAGLDDIVSFLGPLDGDAKRSQLLDADLFVLPTHSESFGMAIAEALAHGLPVLTTTAAPWSMLAERGCGWSVEPIVDSLADGLREATSLQSDTLVRMGSRGRDLVAAEYDWGGIARQFVELYEGLQQHPTERRLPTNESSAPASV